MAIRVLFAISDEPEVVQQQGYRETSEGAPLFGLESVRSELHGLPPRFLIEAHPRVDEIQEVLPLDSRSIRWSLSHHRPQVSYLSPLLIQTTNNLQINYRPVTPANDALQITSFAKDIGTKVLLGYSNGVVVQVSIFFEQITSLINEEKHCSE